jgi:hypothetical protein
VKVGRGRNDMGAYHRAVDVARTLFESGRWNGRGLIVVHVPYDTHRKMSFLREELALGEDYEFAADTVYSGAGPDEAEEDAEAIDKSDFPFDVKATVKFYPGYGYRVVAPEPEREADDDETLVAGQNYGWCAENGGGW